MLEANTYVHGGAVTMNGRKFTALLLAVVLCLGLSVPAMAAETTHEDFQDLMVMNPATNDYQWKWAWPTVDDALRRGLFIGYTPYQDAEGKTITNFGPGDLVTEAVGLTLCARMIVDVQQRETILKDRLEQMRQLIPGTAKDPDDVTAPFMWFRREAASCLELGILSADDLELLRDADRLGKPMTKADFAVYLVRAMGLEDFAKSHSSSNLSFFADEQKIGREYRPYVELLYTYGVLTGDEEQKFNPDQGMNRAVCATMLSRAIENILEEREVAVELPRYETYSFATGIIREVNVDDDGVRQVTLEALDGQHTYKLPSSALIYQNNMPAKATDLKNGSFAKLRFDAKGEVAMVRLIPAGSLSQVEGDCDAVTDQAVVVDGVHYPIDRFTQVSAGGKVGGPELIDLDAGYTTAKLTANSRKTVLSVTLSGGTRQIEGILTDVTTTTQGTITKTTATVNSFSGLPTTYVMTADVAVTSKGQKLAELKESFEGKHVILRVSDSDFSDLKNVDVDLDGQYIQGILQSVSAKQTPYKVEITRTTDTRRTPWEVAEDCVTTYEGKTTELSKLPSATFVTAKLEGATVTQLSAWTGLESVEGTLTAVTYPAGQEAVQLSVKADDGAAYEYAIALEDLKNVTILVDGKDSDVTRLTTGDSVVITLRYHKVNQIDVTPRAANVTGTLDAITFKADGSAVLSVLLSSGVTQDYTADAGVTVTREDSAAALTDVKAGTQVALVTEGSRVLSIQFSGSAVSQSTVAGRIISKDDQSRIATVLPTGADAVPVKVHIGSSVGFLDVTGVNLTRITQLNVGDSVEIYGSYGKDGTFEAKSVIRK